MNERFGSRLSALRADSGLSQNTLAGILGLAVSTLSRMESGEMVNPTIDTVERLAGFYGVTREWLLDGKEPMFVSEDADVARERFHALLREKLGDEDDFERREQQVMAEISVRLFQAPYSSAETWKTYREQIIAAVDAHAGFCMKHAPELRMARLRVGRAMAEKKKR